MHKGGVLITMWFWADLVVKEDGRDIKEGGNCASCRGTRLTLMYSSDTMGATLVCLSNLKYNPLKWHRGSKTFLLCQITRLLKDCKNLYIFFSNTPWFSSYRLLKVKGKHCFCTGSKKLSTSNFLQNGVKLFNYPSPLRKRIVCTLSDAQVSKYNIIRYEL